MPENARAPAPARAGEGGGLPKGLSLFRFILFSMVMAGALYGGVSLSYNAPPPPGDIAPNGASAAEWSPNPAWLPAFAAIKLHIGVAATPRGYVFSSRIGYALHAVTSIVFGMGIGGLAGWFGGEAVRRWAVQKRYE
jgi:hypothetical protein